MFHRIARFLSRAFAAMLPLVAAGVEPPSPENATRAFDDVAVSPAPGFLPAADFPDLRAFYEELDARTPEGRVVARCVLPDAGGALRAEAVAVVPASLDGKRCSLAYFRAIFDSVEAAAFAAAANPAAPALARPVERRLAALDATLGEAEGGGRFLSGEIREPQLVASNEIRYGVLSESTAGDALCTIPAWEARAIEMLWIKGRVIVLACMAELGDRAEADAALSRLQAAAAAWAADTLRANRLLPPATDLSEEEDPAADSAEEHGSDLSAPSPFQPVLVPPEAPFRTAAIRAERVLLAREAEELAAEEEYARKAAGGRLLEPPRPGRRRALARLADMALSLLGLSLGLRLLLRYRARRRRFAGVR